MLAIFNTPQKTLLMLAMIACYALIFIDESGIAVTLPAIQNSFALTTNDMHWIINSYLLMLSVLLLLGGKLSDCYGQRFMFLLGLGGFIIASLICASAQNNAWLISGRIAQGVAASVLLPCISVLIKNHFPQEHFGKAFGLIIGFSNLFYALGPFIGGLVTQYLSWRWFFWLNLPIGLLCYGFTHFSASEQAGSGSHFSDIKGLLSFVISISLLVFALMQSSVWTWYDPRVLLSLIAGFVVLAVFVLFELKNKRPLLDLRLFKIRNFSAGNLILLCLSICLTLIVFCALWLQKDLGFSPTKVGLALLPATLTFIFVPHFAGVWHDHSGAKPPLLLGCMLVLLSLVWMVCVIPLQNYLWFFAGLILFGFGIPLAIPNSIMTIMNSAPAEQAGAASGTFTTIRQLGLTLGIALFSAMGSMEAGTLLFAGMAFIALAASTVLQIKKPI